MNENDQIKQYLKIIETAIWELTNNHCLRESTKYKLKHYLTDIPSPYTETFSESSSEFIGLTPENTIYYPSRKPFKKSKNNRDNRTPF
jgi:hypothetical protein